MLAATQRTSILLTQLPSDAPAHQVMLMMLNSQCLVNFSQTQIQFSLSQEAGNLGPFETPLTQTLVQHMRDVRSIYSLTRRLGSTALRQGMKKHAASQCTFGLFSVLPTHERLHLPLVWAFRTAPLNWTPSENTAFQEICQLKRTCLNSCTTENSLFSQHDFYFVRRPHCFPIQQLLQFFPQGSVFALKRFYFYESSAWMQQAVMLLFQLCSNWITLRMLALDWSQSSMQENSIHLPSGVVLSHCATGMDSALDLDIKADHMI